jgi:hypothetical protein
MIFHDEAKRRQMQRQTIGLIIFQEFVVRLPWRQQSGGQTLSLARGKNQTANWKPLKLRRHYPGSLGVLHSLGKKPVGVACGCYVFLRQITTVDPSSAWINLAPGIGHKIIIIPPIPSTAHLTLSGDLGEVPQVSVRPRTRSQNSISIAFVFDSF